ncbi:kinase-like protein [Auricularia subglabra TFB-10046 SS5]|nr:kinase-like protein [Auricularia subglabra TFB-10046 SS5]
MSARLGGGFYDVRHDKLAQGPGGPVAVAVTTIRDDERNARRPLLARSAAALGQITHPNVERLIQTHYPGQNFCVVTEWPDGGDLRTYLATNSHTDANALSIARAIAVAVRDLHAMTPCIMHGNLDLSTVLMHGDAPRLWDFALCRFDPAPLAGPLINLVPAADARDGMLTSMAPELASGLVTMASDVYAFGMLLFELFARHRPFSTMTPFAAASHLHGGQRPLRAELPPGPRCDGVWAIVTQCWADNPAVRPTMAQVYQGLLLVL